MVGTARWNALVTMAVAVANGKVVVGPHNTEFHPHAASRVWLRKDGDRDFSTMWSAKRIPSFTGQHHLRRLQLRTLDFFASALCNNSKSSLAWSGIKVASFVSHQLFTCGKIVKSDVTEHLQKVKAGKIRAEKDSGIIGNLIQLVEAMQDEEVSPVSEFVSKQHMELAGRLQGDVTNINKTTITEGVVKVIEGMVQGRQNKK